MNCLLIHNAFMYSKNPTHFRSIIVLDVIFPNISTLNKQILSNI